MLSRDPSSHLQFLYADSHCRSNSYQEHTVFQPLFLLALEDLPRFFFYQTRTVLVRAHGLFITDMDFIAFYLPQFHPIPENDAIYGQGFTEWDNVRRAKKLFPGHYQPHVPQASIGWYNLLDDKFLEYQHALAYDHGITGFCYYYYNFSGTTLLEQPLIKLRNNPIIRNSYCLCWAHPSWYDNRIGPSATFVTQTYSPENAVRLFWGIREYLKDHRYICINGRPLFLIWAPERNPLIREYTAILHEEAIRYGLPGICLAGVEAYAALPPAELGLDIMVEFAPNWRLENQISLPEERPRRMDYAATLAFMLQKPTPSYTRLRCTFPSWDNTPRRGMDGIACTGIRTDLFDHALTYLAHYTQAVLSDELQYVFINAWNEWGEGCHLEPDERYGSAWLDSISRTKQRFAKKETM